MKRNKLVLLSAAMVAGSFLILGTRPSGIAAYYHDVLTPAAFGLWLTGFVIATLAPPCIAITCWLVAARARHSWPFHVALVPVTYVVVRGAIALMLFAAREPDSDGLTGWATDPAVLLMVICPAAYFLVLCVLKIKRERRHAKDS